MSVAAVLTRASELLFGGAGDRCVIDAGTILPLSAPVTRRGARATETLDQPRARVHVPRLTPHSAQVLCGVELQDLQLRVDLALAATVSDTFGAPDIALAGQIADLSQRVTLTLCAPGAMDQTIAGASTEIIGGTISHQSTTISPSEADGAENYMVQSTVVFAGIYCLKCCGEEE